jgi:hypothetical protein
MYLGELTLAEAIQLGGPCDGDVQGNLKAGATGRSSSNQCTLGPFAPSAEAGAPATAGMRAALCHTDTIAVPPRCHFLRWHTKGGA